MSSLFRELDEEATIANVKNLLGNYHRIRRNAKRNVSDLQSPTITDMPKVQSVDNGIEKQIVDRVSAQMIYTNINFTIAAIEQEDLKQILICKFIKYDMSDTNIQDELSLSQATYYRRFRGACLTFADIYGMQELRVFNK